VVATLLCLAFVAVMAVTVQPAAAITYGEPDNGAHPNVGMVVAGIVDEDGEAAAIQLGSGTLIAPDVFLTAGHVADAIDSWGLEFLGVTFEERFDPEDDSDWLTGTMILHPGYRWGAADKCDLAIVILDPEDTVGIEPAQLPTEGLLDAMAADKTLRRQTFTCVGYGLTERTHGATGPPDYGGYDEVRRRFVTSGFISLTPAWVHMSQNPALDFGGSCFGDSGGPNFLGDSDMVVAITSRGDAVCRSSAVNYRLDTPSARSFLEEYVVELP
jgi:hypothetical protein